MIKVFIPRVRTNELKYALEVCLGQFLGLTFSIDIYDKTDVEICHTDSTAKLTLNTDFFVKGNDKWLCNDSLPILPLKNWSHINDGINIDLESDSLPVLYGTPGLLKKGNHWHFNVDVLGTIFFMLSRYEEAGASQKDKHGRFPADCSIAYKANFLERPIVDEYVEVLWFIMEALWPLLERKKRVFKSFVTCDVDIPFDPLRSSLLKTIKRSASDILKRKSIKLAIQKWKFYFADRCKIKQPDSCRDMIGWMMTENEKRGNKVAFYFITECTSKFDLRYDFDSSKMRLLFQEIHNRGHEIGLHPGYECYKNNKYFNKSVSTLIRILEEEGIEQEQIGGRMHYLRWDSLRTPELWDSSGLHYDSTLSYAEMSGFRCGTSHEFTMFDVSGSKSFKLKQRPLINMECTIISDIYEGLGVTKDAFERFRKFSEICKKYDGNYILLWHNTSLGNPEERKLYLNVLDQL